MTGGVDYGRVRRPVPVGKALDDVLLAYEMNGRTLPADHGFPLRLVVPGWIGISSIKWLGRLEVSDAPIETAWNTKWYPGLSVQPVKSAFELAWDATVPAGRKTVLSGRSWSGRAPIRRVEVSTARHGPLQRGRLPVLGRRPPPSDRGSVGPRGVAPARGVVRQPPQGQDGG